MNTTPRPHLGNGRPLVDTVTGSLVGADWTDAADRFALDQIEEPSKQR